MAPRGARGAVSEPSDEAAPAAVTANGPPSDPEGAAKDSSGDVAATVEKPPGALGESKGPEPDGGAAEAEGAAEANNTENKADEKAGAVLDQLRDEADKRVNTVHAEPTFTSKTFLERFKVSPALKKGTDTFRFEKLLPTALLYCTRARPTSARTASLSSPRSLLLLPLCSLGDPEAPCGPSEAAGQSAVISVNTVFLSLCFSSLRN